jgi:hypothetical protein
MIKKYGTLTDLPERTPSKQCCGSGSVSQSTDPQTRIDTKNVTDQQQCFKGFYLFHLMVFRVPAQCYFCFTIKKLTPDPKVKHLIDTCLN